MVPGASPGARSIPWYPEHHTESRTVPGAQALPSPGCHSTWMGPAVGALPWGPASPGSPDGDHSAPQHPGEAETMAGGVQWAGVSTSAPTFATWGGRGGLQAVQGPAPSTNLLLKPKRDFGALQYKLINFYVLINGSY